MARILLVCNGNSSRSPMAEALWRWRSSSTWQVDSAGISPVAAVNFLAVEVMSEWGLDLSGHTPRSIQVFSDQPYDLMITLSRKAKEAQLGWKQIKLTRTWEIEDPFQVSGPLDVRRDAYRRVRDHLDLCIRTELRLWTELRSSAE